MQTRRAMLAMTAAASATPVHGAPETASPGRLGPIRAVTTTASRLGHVEAVYSRYLSYAVLERGVVGPELARSWGAPATAGRRFLAMAPESGEPTLLRFVEQAAPRGFRPMTSFGWSATEIIVRNTDAVAERLAVSPFQIVGPPRDLDSSSEIRAMQAIGPADEMLYLTSTKGPMPGRDMPTAEAFVGRCFIAVLGAPDKPAAERFYRERFGNGAGPTFNARIRNISAQNGLPPETRYDLSVIALGGGTKLEVDQFPSLGRPRPQPPGGLPAGMAMVSFECSAFEDFRAQFVGPPSTASHGPHRGRRSGVLRGAAGELIELLEA